jgi:hypothetical protein
MPQLLGPFDLLKKVAAEVDLPQLFFQVAATFFFLASTESWEIFTS